MNHPSLLIRRARAADAEDFRQMMADPEVYADLMQLPMPSVVGSAGLHPASRLRRRHCAALGRSVALQAR